MADRVPRLQVVPPGDDPPARRRAPGAAVILVLVYGLVFGGGLWLIRPRKRPAAAPSAHPAQSAAAPKRDAPSPSPDASREDSARRRGAILAGAAIPMALRPRYLARIAADHCDCGCDLTLQACLARDTACSRSVELAGQIGASLR